MSLAPCKRSMRSTGAGVGTATRPGWWVISIVSPARTRRIVAVRLSRSSRMPVCPDIVPTCCHNFGRSWAREGRAHALTWRSTILDRPVRDGVIGNTRASGARIWGSSPCPGVVGNGLGEPDTAMRALAWARVWASGPDSATREGTLSFPRRRMLGCSRRLTPSAGRSI